MTHTELPPMYKCCVSVLGYREQIYDIKRRFRQSKHISYSLNDILKRCRD
jgi:hypothetical protein